MTRASHRLWLCALCVLGAAVPAGCLLMLGDPDDCDTSTGWVVLDARDLRVEGRLRLEYRIVLTITREGASSEAHDELRTASLELMVSPGDVGRVGFSGADGSDVPYESYTSAGWYIASLENAMVDCGERECSREFLVWAEVVGERLADVRGRLTIPVEDCGENDGWLQFEAERIADPPDASTAPPDGGVGP